jgi:arylsulfatase A-like enzyme
LTLAAPAALLFAVVSLLLSAIVPRTGFRDASLGWMARTALIAGEVVLTCLLGLAVSALALLYDALAARFPRRRTAIRFVALAVAWFVTFAYLSSWALFATFGSFLDARSLSFALSSAKLLVKHVLATNPILLSLLPLVALAIVLAARQALIRLKGRAPIRSVEVLAGTVAALGLVFVLVGELGPAESHTLVKDAVLGTKLSLGGAYRTARTHRSGPLTHLLLLRGRNSVAALVTDDVAGQRVHPVYKKQVRLDDWVRSIDPAAIKRWNVVLVLFDSAQPSVLRSLGGTVDVMPALDRLAESSLRFSMYAQASHSNYADPAVVSSHYPLRDPEHHKYPTSPPYPRVLVYDILKKLGWRTAVVSSQNEHWGQMHEYLNTGSLDHFFHAESLKTATIPEADPGFADWAKAWGYSGKIDDRETIDEAIRFIDRGGDQPFFMYVNLQNSHFPYHTPEGHPRPFQPDTIDFPYSFGNYPEDKVEIVKNRWRNSLRYVDGQIARLVNHITQKGLMDRTLFAIGADNGEAFYEHGIVCHAGTLFDESVRVPVVMHGPGFAPGTYPGLSQALDIVPTVLGRLGLPPHPSFQGTDLLSTEVDPSRAAYIVAQTPKADQLAMVRDGYKVIYDYWFDTYLLFDITRDPGEKHDLAAAETGRLRVMANELRAWEKAQLHYYSSSELMKTSYPPLLAVMPAAGR